VVRRRERFQSRRIELRLMKHPRGRSHTPGRRAPGPRPAISPDSAIVPSLTGSPAKTASSQFPARFVWGTGAVERLGCAFARCRESPRRHPCSLFTRIRLNAIREPDAFADMFTGAR
jgi:hypothetical protein